MTRCLLICEGPCDELILSLFKNVFCTGRIEIKPSGSCCFDKKNLLQNVGDLVQRILSKEKGYSISDFDEISFLFDSDGIYIDEQYITVNIND
ncbi:MAG: hypothetical protein WC154_08325, partial [Candidatus Izemoplasmatales bacterium]